MTFKQQFKRIILATLLLYIFLSGLMNLFIDPFGKFNLISIDGLNKFKYNYEQQDVFNKFFQDSNINTLIFGTSRSAVMGKEDFFTKNSMNVLNLSDAVYGNPKDILRYLEFALKYNNSVKNVFIAIDLHVYQMNNRIGRLRNELFYFSPSLYNFISTSFKLSPFYNYLSFYNIENNFKNNQPKAPQNSYGIREYLHDALEKKKIEITSLPKQLIYGQQDLYNFQKILTFLHEKKIEVYFYTIPNSIWYYQSTYSLEDVTKFNLELSKYVPYYNFTFINSITSDPKNYYDFSHYGSKINNYILDAIFSNKNEIYIDNQMFYKYEDKK